MCVKENTIRSCTLNQIETSDRITTPTANSVASSLQVCELLFSGREHLASVALDYSHQSEVDTMDVWISK